MSLKALEPASPLSNLSGERISPARKRASSRTLRSKFPRLPGPPLRSGRCAVLAVGRGALRSLSAEPSQGGPATQAKGDHIIAITLGIFTKLDDGVFTGTLKTLNVTAALTIVPIDKMSENAPD